MFCDAMISEQIRLLGGIEAEKAVFVSHFPSESVEASGFAVLARNFGPTC